MILSLAHNGDKDFDWKELAECRGTAQKCRDDGTVVDFFFDTFENDEDAREDILNLFCRRCPVRQNCLIAGLTNGESGLWGGEWLENGTIQG